MRLLPAWVAGLAATAFAALAAPSAELLDLAGRVHFGYYHAEPRAIEAASAALDRLADSPHVLYYRDFAALRRAQLGAPDRAAREHLAACARREAEAGLDKRFAAEVWVLAAACAHVAGDDARRDKALSLARQRDDDNPRIALVEAWALRRAAETDSAEQPAALAKLRAVVEAFDAWTPSIDDPDWGEAEALAALAAAALEEGQVRSARDLIERSLLLAPDYRSVLELRATMQNARAGGGTL
jgi:hypothetical protein